MEIIERNGRYFVQCTDGEVEITLEDMIRQTETLTELKSYLQDWINTYGHNAWKIGEAPEDADAYLAIADFFRKTKIVYQRLYDEADNKQETIRDLRTTCSMTISKLKVDIANPYGNKSRLNFQLAGWEDLKEFVGLFDLYSKPILETELTQDLSDGLREELKKYGFLDLILTKNLSESAQRKVVELAISHDLPYQIALFDFLGFIRHLETTRCKTKVNLYKTISKILGTHERAVKGNISVLNPKSTEDRDRYSAHRHTEKVKRDYQNIK